MMYASIPASSTWKSTPQSLVQPVSNSRTSAFESAGVILALFFFSSAFTNETQGYSYDTTREDIFIFMFQFIVYLWLTPFILRMRKNIFLAFKQLFWILALLVLALLSSAWSQAPVDTLKHSVLLTFTTVFGTYLGTRFEPKEQIRYLTVFLGASIVLSFAMGLFLPSYGIMRWEHYGAWRGIYPHRNSLARIMAFAAVIYLMRWRTKGLDLGTLLGLGGAALLVVLSGSITGMIVFVFLMIFFKGSFVIRWRSSKLLTATIAAVPLALLSARWLFQNWVPVMDKLGRNPTLSGRVYLWILSIFMAVQRPLLGYGYTGFWRGATGPSARIWKALNWPAPNAHNGFLDLWLSLGFVGLSIFLVGFVVVLWRSLNLARTVNNPIGFWPLAYLFFLFLYNLDESDLFQHNSIFWAFFITVCVSLRQTSWLAEQDQPSTLQVRLSPS